MVLHSAVLCCGSDTSDSGLSSTVVLHFKSQTLLTEGQESRKSEKKSKKIRVGAVLIIINKCLLVLYYPCDSVYIYYIIIIVFKVIVMT